MSAPLLQGVRPDLRRLVQRVSQSAVSWSLLATALRFGSAILVLPLVLRSLPPAELGIWYVFIALGALASLLDLGFAGAVTRSVGYLWAGARTLRPFGIDVAAQEEAAPSNVTAAPNVESVAALIRSLRVYYSVAGTLMLLLLSSVGGAWIWQKTSGFANPLSIRLAFFTYAAGVSLTFANSVWPALLVGVNAVRQAQRITVACLAGNYCIAAVGLLCGFGLWSLVAGTVIGGIAERILGRAAFNRLIAVPRGRFDFSIITVLWPNAWRTGVVALGGFMVVHANTLICSAFLDLSTTASYGLTLQAVMLIAGVSSVWVVVKLPVINQLRVTGQPHQIAALFRSRILLAIATFIVGAAALITLGPMTLEFLRAKTPLLPWPFLVTLLLIVFLETHHSLYGGLVFSENVNPFVKPALLSGIATVTLSVILTPRIGLWGMLLSSGVVQLSFNNWWTVLRAVRGLGAAADDYWRGFLRLPFRSGTK